MAAISFALHAQVPNPNSRMQQRDHVIIRRFQGLTARLTLVSLPAQSTR